MNYKLKLPILAGIILISLMGRGVAFAQLTLTPNNSTIMEGGEVEVSVDLASSDLSSLVFTIGFDPDIINIPTDSRVIWNTNRVIATSEQRSIVTNEEGQLTFSAVRTNNAVAVEEGNDQVLRFTVIGISTGTSQLTFSGATQIELGSIEEETLSSTSGSVNVSGEATVEFQSLESIAMEESATHDVVLRITIPGGGSLPGAVSVDVTDRLTDGSATEDVDYTALDGDITTVTFPIGSESLSTQTVGLSILSDNLVEGPETIQLSLGQIDGEANPGSQITHTITIDDDEMASVQFKTPSSSVDEQDDSETPTNHQVEVELSISPEDGILADSATFEVLDTGDGTATAGEDYDDFDKTMLTFPANAANGSGPTDPFSLSIINDIECKGDRSVKLELQNVGGLDLLGDQKAHTINIREDEPLANDSNFTATLGEEIEITINALRGEVGSKFYVSTVSQPVNNYDQQLSESFVTDKMGTIGSLQDPLLDDVGTISVGMTWKPADNFRGIDQFFFIIENSDGIRSCEGRVTIAVGLPPWYPFFTWKRISDLDWYNIKISESDDFMDPVFETNVNRLEMPIEQYLLDGFNGFIPSQYQWQVRSWEPVNDTFGDPVDADPDVDDIQNFKFDVLYDLVVPNPVPETMMIEEIENGVYELTFTVENASGYEIEIDALSNNNLDQIIRKAFSLDANNTVSFNQETILEIHLSTPDSYRISVRGFNPCSDEGNECVDDNNAIIDDGFSEFVEFPGSPIIISEPVLEKTPGQPTGLFPKTGSIITVVDESGEVATNLQWNSVASATSYTIYLGAVGGIPILNFENVGNVTCQPVSLPPGSYSWMVIGLNDSASVPFGQWSDSQRFEVVAKIDVPVITGAVKDDTEGNDGTSVKITWAPGTDPVKVDVWHYNSTFTSGRWNIESDLDVAIDEEDPNNNGRFDFPDPFPDDGVDYLFIRGKNGEKEGKFKLFVIP